MLVSTYSRAAAADKPIDFSGAQGHEIVLFYPGLASWEFLLSDDHRLGGKSIVKLRKDCRHCHLSKEGELDMKVNEIAAGTIKMKRSNKPFEPEPITGRKGTLQATVWAAYDKENLYVRVRWESMGTGWLARPPAEPNPDRISIQMNKTEKSFAKYGCFIACHNDLESMPGAPSKKTVAANSYYRDLGRDDVRLYAYYARDSWSRPKSAGTLETLKKTGGVIDLLSLEIDGAEVKSMDGWVLDDRRWEKTEGLSGTASWEALKYTAVFTRRLSNPGPYDVDIKEGDRLTIGLAIHEDGAKKRKHFVSFPITIGVGTDGDVQAVKLSR